MFFQSWAGLLRIVIVGAAAYAALILLLRYSGKRTLAKMNAFDLVITVALGSALATTVLSKDVALAEGVLAFAVLIALQFAISWLSVRSPYVRRLVKSEPQLLFHDGRFLPEAMRRERITEAEIRAAVRAEGIAAMEQVGAVVLETDGSFAVVQTSPQSPASALRGVQRSDSRYGHFGE